MALDLSIIIPTHNSQHVIKNCLNSLVSQNYPREKYEIIIVDDGSNDDTVKICKEIGVDDLIIVEPCFQGKARNIGAQNAKSNRLAFIDSDCQAKPEWIEFIVINLELISAVTGPIHNGNPKNNIAWAEYFIEFGGWDKKKKQQIRFMPGCNQAIRKDVFEEIGGFSEERTSEDVLFGESLTNAGIQAFFIPQIQINHFCRTDKEKFLVNMNLLGKYSVKARKKDPKTKYSKIITNPNLVWLVFLGKITKTVSHGISSGNVMKLIKVLPLIFAGVSSFCDGIKDELKN